MVAMIVVSEIVTTMVDVFEIVVFAVRGEEITLMAMVIVISNLRYWG